MPLVLEEKNIHYVLTYLYLFVPPPPSLPPPLLPLSPPPFPHPIVYSYMYEKKKNLHVCSILTLLSPIL